MKKKSFLIATLLVVMAAATAVVSCKKERHDQNSNGNEQTVQNADNMDEYLISFKKKLLSAEKGGEAISLEQAERDLGNLLNFDFGDANYATDVLQHDTLHAKLALTADGQVDLSQLAVTYNTLFEEILNTYHQTDIPEKSVYAILCNFNEMSNKDGENMDAEIVMISRGFRGYKRDTNDWRPNDRGGTCDGQDVNYCGAPEIVTNWLNYGKIVHMDCEFGRVYYTNFGTASKQGRDTYNSATGSYDIYCSGFPYYMVCLSHETLVQYCNTIWAYWCNRNFDPTPPTGREAMDFEIHYGPAYPNSTVSMWTVTVHYAKPNCTSTGPVF